MSDEHDPVRNPYTSSDSSADDTQQLGATTISQSARINQLISMALVAGIVVITGVLLYLVLRGAGQKDLFIVDKDSIIFLGIGFGVTILAAIAGVFMRSMTKHTAANEFISANHKVSLPVAVDESFPGCQTLLGGYATANLIGAALMEGPAVINAIFMLIGENLLHLIPIAFAVLGILYTLPTTTRVKNYVEDVVSRLQ